MNNLNYILFEKGIYYICTNSSRFVCWRYFSNTPKKNNTVVKNPVNKILSGRAFIKEIFIPSVSGPNLFGNKRIKTLNSIPIMNPTCATVARRTKIIPSVWPM